VTKARAQADRRTPLAVYLNDHLAGATSGTALARRMARVFTADEAQKLGALAAEIAQDRRTLVRLMADLGVPLHRWKIWAGWTGEKVGRLKTNGHLVRRAPVSSLLELEMLRLGVEGKAAVWRTLRLLAARDRRLDAGELERLLERASRQVNVLERLRLTQAARALDGG
jgi:hypothetical protein